MSQGTKGQRENETNKLNNQWFGVMVNTKNC